MKGNQVLDSCKKRETQNTTCLRRQLILGINRKNAFIQSVSIYMSE